MRTAPSLALALLVPLLAGCLQGAPGPVDDVQRETRRLVPIPLFPIEQDHDHADPHLHDDAANLDRVSFHSGYGDGATGALPSGQGFSELFVRDHLAFLGRRGGPDGGFVIFDVTDPSQPRRLGAFQGLANYDMESTQDNRYVFFVSQFLNNQQPASLPPRGPGDVPRAIHVVDVSDPTRPEWIGGFPVPTRGVHTLTYHRTDAGRELIAAQTYDFVPDPSLGLPVPDQGINPISQRVILFDFLRTPTPRLVPLSTYERHDLPLLNEFFPHDVAIQKHPVTGQLIMYVAYWDLGAFLVDITDPTQPKELSRLADFSPSRLRMVHLAAPADRLIDGRHITVTEPEIGPAPETGQFTLFDTTDPTRPQRLGYWTLPGQLINDQGLRFSPHNFEVEDGRLYLAHYHAGVWVVDVSNGERLQNPETLAFAQPNESRRSYSGDSSNVWTALYHQGYVFASDIATGLYVYKYAGDPDAPAEDAPHVH
jgi:hypothetical protein